VTSSTASLSVIPEPQTVIFDELFVCLLVLYFLNRGDGNLDETPALMAAHEQLSLSRFLSGMMRL
jgi:hypothetical protein